MHQVEFLAVVLVALQRGIGVCACRGALAEGGTEWIVVRDLLQRAALADHFAVVAQVISVVVVPAYAAACVKDQGTLILRSDRIYQ